VGAAVTDVGAWVGAAATDVGAWVAVGGTAVLAAGGAAVLAGVVAAGAWPPHAAVKTRLSNSKNLSFDIHPSFGQTLRD